MKILLTSDTWTPTVNGVVTSATTLKRELESRGHEVRVLTLSHSCHTYTDHDVTYLGSLDAGAFTPVPVCAALPCTGHCMSLRGGPRTLFIPNANSAPSPPPGIWQEQPERR